MSANEMLVPLRSIAVSSPVGFVHEGPYNVAAGMPSLVGHLISGSACPTPRLVPVAKHASCMPPAAGLCEAASAQAGTPEARSTMRGLMKVQNVPWPCLGRQEPCILLNC